MTTATGTPWSITPRTHETSLPSTGPAGPGAAARAYDDGSDTALGPSTAKYFCSEAVGRIADRAVQVHGGSGYMRGVPVERMYRDVRLFRIYEGTSQIQQVIIARGVLGAAARG